MLSSLRFTRLLALLISIIVLSACSDDSSNTPPTDPSLSLRDQLQIIVDDAVKSGLPGVSLHVQDQGKSISVVAGVVNLETAEPVTASSLFHAASIGKTFTATMLLRLVDMGFLQLDDPIDGLLDTSMSSMIANSDRITVKMLLAHTSGIQDYFNNPEFVDAFVESPGRTWSPTEILGYIDNTENNFEPAAEFRYSNTNYVLLGVIAERVTGVSIGMALRQWVFEPAGLENTFGVFENLGQPVTTHGYAPVNFIKNSGLNIDLPSDGSSYLDMTLWLNSEGHGDASIHSTPSDLNSFIRTLIDTDTLISEELKTQMLTESLPGSGHGLGVFISDDGMTFEHTGGGFGVLTWMSYSPSEDLSLATTVNGSFGNYRELYDEYLTQLILFLERRQ